jgi:hypothetical protein
VTGVPVDGGSQIEGPPARLGWATAAAGAFAITLLRPASWALGLLGFLAGGGLLLVAWPILVLPTPTGLQNLLAAPISSLVFGTLSPALVLLAVSGFVGTAVLILAGTLVGAWAERQGIEIALEAAADDGLRPRSPTLDGGPGTWQIAVVRLLALVPVAVVIVLASGPVYEATYRELVLPRDLVTPLPLRVLGQVPWQILAVACAWLVSDSAAALGVRHLVLERRSVAVAWVLGWGDLVRRPHRVLATALLGTGVLAALLGPSIVAAAIGWGRVREILEAGRDPLTIGGATLIWVAIWLGGLVLAGVGASVRGAAWTLEIPAGEMPVDDSSLA